MAMDNPNFKREIFHYTSGDLASMWFPSFTPQTQRKYMLDVIHQMREAIKKDGYAHFTYGYRRSPHDPERRWQIITGASEIYFDDSKQSYIVVMSNVNANKVQRMIREIENLKDYKRVVTKLSGSQRNFLATLELVRDVAETQPSETYARVYLTFDWRRHLRRYPANPKTPDSLIKKGYIAEMAMARISTEGQVIYESGDVEPIYVITTSGRKALGQDIEALEKRNAKELAQFQEDK
jgi:hypothetical protein